MTLELKKPGVSPPEKIIVTDYKQVNSSSGWDILLRCPNSAGHNNNDDNWSCRGNSAEERVKCPVCGFAAVFWDKDKAHKKGKSYKRKSSKKYLQEAEDKEIKDGISTAIDVDIDNWSGYDDTIKEEVRIRIPYDLCFIPEDERGLVMGAIVKAGIFRITELKSRVKKVKQMLKKQKESIKEEEEEKKKIILTKGWFPGLIHLIKIDGVVHYLLDKDNKLYTAETVKIGDNEFKPKQDLPINYATKKVLDIPRNINFADLLDDVEKFIRRHLEMPEESDYFLLALWVFHTYIIDREFLTPYLYFYGAYGTGKSQAGHVMKHIAYKAENLTTVTSASLFRGIQYYKNTLIIDEIKLWGYNSNPDILSVILSGYQRKDSVPRVDLNEKKDTEDQIKYYDVFGPKAICTTEAIEARIKSRCLYFIMKQNVRVAVEDLIDQDEKSLDQAEYLRNCLTIFRANFLNKKFKKLDKIARRRLGQILTPLYRIVMEIVPEREEEFKEIVKQLDKKRKEVKTLSLEAEVIQVFVDKVKGGIDSIGSKDLCEILNVDRSITAEISTSKLYYKMAPLGFEKTKSQPRKWFIDKEILERLKEEYL
ncbi:hypothetical protein ES705_21707 [subsurface metagenome]